MGRHAYLVAIALALGWPAPTEAADLTGRASVIDGDTIEIRGQSVRLHGIDAPESRQLCQADDRQYRCGQRAAFVLADKIGDHTVACRQTDTDQYGRAVAVCTVVGEDIGAWMVTEGWALAFVRYSSDYVDEEAAAKAEGRGIWRGSFEPPWDWRRSERLSQEKAAAPLMAAPGGECIIKGNISKSGERIYHMPGQQHYDRTVITESKGERWFCAEAEAEAAGWRKAKR